MAFVPRKNKDNKFVFEESSIKPSNSDTLRKSQIQSEELITNLKSERKTYMDMTIEVIESLEKDGINIFDKNRKPGMYQKGKKGVEEVQINNIIESLSRDNKKFEGFDEDLKKPKNTNNINHLLNFFNKDK